MNGPQITFFGNLVQDPESRFARNSGKPFTTMRVAVNTYRGREREPETNYFNVTLWGTQAQNALTRCRKGHRVYVEGLYSQNEYTRRDGTTGTGYNVNAKDFMHMGAPRSDGPDADGEAQTQQGQPAAQNENPRFRAPRPKTLTPRPPTPRSPTHRTPTRRKSSKAPPKTRLRTNLRPARPTTRKQSQRRSWKSTRATRITSNSTTDTPSGRPRPPANPGRPVQNQQGGSMHHPNPLRLPHPGTPHS